MEITTAIIISTLISTSVSILVKVIWDWASNKNGKKDIEELEKRVDKKIDSKFSYVNEVKSCIEEQRKDFAELKNLILTSYVKIDEYSKLLNRFENVRDMTLLNQNNLGMLQDTVRQNVDRMSQIEDK